MITIHRGLEHLKAVVLFRVALKANPVKFPVKGTGP